MRIRIEDIPVKGRSLRFDAAGVADGDAVGRALDGELLGLSGEMRIERAGAGAVVAVTGTATVRRPCDRCLAPVDVTVEADQRLAYQPASSVKATGEVQLEEADLDAGFFDGEALDTFDVLSEAFALAAPLRVTCAGDACAPVLDEASSAGARTGHNPFAALKDLLEN